MANPNVGYTAMAFSATPRAVGANITIPDPIRPISKVVGASTTIPEPIRPISKAVGASTTIPDPIRAIPKAMGANTTILDPIRAISEAMGATTYEEEMTDQAPFRTGPSGIPRRRRGRLKQQSMVDPAVLLATPRSYWLESSTTGQIKPDIDGTDYGEED